MTKTKKGRRENIRVFMLRRRGRWQLPPLFLLTTSSLKHAGHFKALLNCSCSCSSSSHKLTSHAGSLPSEPQRGIEKKNQSNTKLCLHKKNEWLMFDSMNEGVLV